MVDLETTGGSPVDCAITEIGAVKLRGGECLATFQTLVNPGGPIPPFITFLTGITEAMVLPAPRVEAVLPAFLELTAGCVLVGHNVRFDVAFLEAAMVRADHERSDLPPAVVDTCALARRLLADEVPDCRLGSLARCFRLPHRPTHRALDDALATGDLLHLLLERAGPLGVLALDDLLALPGLAGHSQVGKLRLTRRLPRSPGVYVFRDRRGRVLHVGSAVELRHHVRSYFATTGGRRVEQLLRATAAVDHVECGSLREAAALRAELVDRHAPRFDVAPRRRRRRRRRPDPAAVASY